MKVMLVNGSPHKEGCTYTALSEVGKALEGSGIETGTFWIGVKPLSGCIACKTCVKKHKCVFDDAVNEFLDIAGDYDGFVFGTPVHWGGASGGMTSFMDRAFYADLCGGGHPLAEAGSRHLHQLYPGLSTAMEKRGNAILDCLMVVLLPLLMAYSMIGESIHEWLGIATLLLFLGHHALNWRWYRSLPRGKWSPVRMFQADVNTALLL